MAYRGIHFERERVVQLEYRDVRIGEYIPDLIVENKVVVEVKSVLRDEDVFTAQMLTYLRLTQLRVGLIPQLQQTLAEGWHKASGILKRASVGSVCSVVKGP